MLINSEHARVSLFQTIQSMPLRHLNLTENTLIYQVRWLHTRTLTPNYSTQMLKSMRRYKDFPWISQRDIYN